MNLIESSRVIIVFWASSVLCWLATYAIRRWAPKVGLLDIPNERSSHKKPIPRGGGLSFVFITPVMTAITFSIVNIGAIHRVWPILLGSLLIAIISLADDRWHLPILLRFGAHGASALIILVGTGYLREVVLPGGILLQLGSWGLPLTFIWIVGLTNAFNFMDGIDGLAAGHAIIAAMTVSWLARLRGADLVAWAMIIIAGSVSGFLLHNWPPAKIFMGDVGSAFLGFTFAGLSILSRESGTNCLPIMVWVVIMAPFIFDTVTTLILRIVRRLPWYRSHREHFYQRLLKCGWSHLAVTSLYLGITTFLGGVTIAYYGFQKISTLLFVGFVFIPLLGIVLVVWLVEINHI